MSGLNFKMPSEKELQFRDDVSDVLHEIDKLVNRLKMHAKAQVSMEHSQAELEGREVKVGFGRDNVRQIVMTACMQMFGGAQGEIAADASPGD